jgi:hypothetical protein
MKTTVLLLLATMTASISTVSAQEESYDDDYYKQYCTDQAEQAGIENEEDFKQYVKDCLESYIGPSGE